MKVFKTKAVSITSGLLVNLIVMAHLLSVALKWRTGSDSTLLDFLSDPARFLFAIYISILLLCIWLIRGSNNRLIYTFWCLGNSLHYFLYWSGMEVFFYTELAQRNIYVLNWLSTVCIIPLLFLYRYKSFISIYVLAVLIRFNLCKSAAESCFTAIKLTDFESKMRRSASLWFVVEFIFSAYLTLFALYQGLGYTDSLRQAIVSSGLPNPFPIYYWVLSFVTFYFALLILINSIRDYKAPDWQSMSALSQSQRRDMIKGRKPSKFDPF